MSLFCVYVAATVLASVCITHSLPHFAGCDVRARTDAGWVCGLRRRAENGATYASFRGVPYAKQPVGELRFKELEPAEPWEYDYDARDEGPICYQTDVFYGKLMQPQGMSEACIHANIHVPFEALPTDQTSASDIAPPYNAARHNKDDDNRPSKGLPILVFIHGGGFAFGSGDADFHGPEYLVSRGVILITFNYRINVFGFLSLNTTKIPGNAGLRDMVTLLRWVQKNARFFGGDPDNVTLGGQSAGAISAHLLSMSKAADGLFKRAILMSGVANSYLYSPTPAFAQYIAAALQDILGIKSKDPDEIHQQLIELPVEKINEANGVLLEYFGLSTFVPVVETPLPGVTTIIEDYPEVLIAKGRDKDIPLMVSFTDAECEGFHHRLLEFDIVGKIKQNPTLAISPKVLFITPPEELLSIAKELDREYFDGNVTIDNFIKLCSDSYFEYPAIDFVIKRAEQGEAPLYLYRFAYEAENSVVQEAFGLKHKKVGHIEDLSYIFRINSMLGKHSSFPPKTRDDRMKYWMTTFITNFMINGEPVTDRHGPAHWPPVSAEDIVFEEIEQPDLYLLNRISQKQRDQIKHFHSLNNLNDE